MSNHRFPLPQQDPSPRQRSVRARASRLSLEDAVRLAADTFFRFTHRAEVSNALWSRRERVWMGSKTFFNWAMDDVGIDMPWLVSGVADAPEKKDELRAAVRAELAVYWKEQLAALPRKSTPAWPPLP